MTPEQHQAARDAKADDLRADAIEELENDDRLEAHEAGDHAERRDEYCADCEHDLEEAYAEHAWMATAVKSWSGPNPYAPMTYEERVGLWREKEYGDHR